MIATSELRHIIEEQLAKAPRSQFRHPLGYVTWGVDEIMAALECLCSHQTTMWTRTEAFEQQFCDYLKANNAVMLNSGSSADLVMMFAARESGLLNRGDEILIPAVTWPTQVWAAIESGFSVKLVDVDPITLNASWEHYSRAITKKTKAIFPVHLMGNPCQMDDLRQGCKTYNLLLFEDCCEALGATFDGKQVGTFGFAAAFSFFASHHITTMEGGMIVTDNDDFADACRLMRAHGWARDLRHRVNDVDVLNRYGYDEDPRYMFLGMGFNFRPTEINAAFGTIQLEKLNQLNEKRNENFAKVAGGFRSTNGHVVSGLLPTSHKAKPAWFALPFVLQADLPYTRKQVAAHLQERGIDTRPIVGGNLARHPAFTKYRLAKSQPGADAIHDRGFYLGLPPVETSMDFVIGALNAMDSNLRMAAC